MFLIGGALKRFKFNLIAFVIGFIVGICYIYQKAPDLVEQIVYPTPYNCGKITYKNKNGDCFQYVAEPVDCPEDQALIKQHTIGANTPSSSSSSIYDKFKNLFK